MKQNSCEVKIDVAFLLDSSGSLRSDYGKEKDFLKAVVSTFGLATDGARAGVITFSYFSVYSIKLHDYHDINAFNDAVDKIPLMGSTTRIDKALRLTQTEVFETLNGGRKNVTKLLILLTDGSQTKDNDAENPTQIAEELRKNGINIIVVGIGPEVNNQELENIGKTGNVYSAASFDELIGSNFVHKIKEASCKIGKWLGMNGHRILEGILSGRCAVSTNQPQ